MCTAHSSQYEEDGISVQGLPTDPSWTDPPPRRSIGPGTETPWIDKTPVKNITLPQTSFSGGND